MRILLLGDYSNCHAKLAMGLKSLGHDVTLMRPLNYLSSEYKDGDITLIRKPGKIGGLFFLVEIFTRYQKYMRGYDVVAINDPVFLSLRPKWLKMIFKTLKENNGKVFYTAMSTDVNYLRMCERGDLKINEYFINGQKSPWFLQHPEKWEAWHDAELTQFQDYIFDNLDGGVSVLYEYHVGLQYRFTNDRIAYGGLPINVGEIDFVGVNPKNKVKLLLCRDKNRILMKGSDLLEKASLRILNEFPQDVELDIAENLPYNIFLEKLKKSDIILDQAYSYTPATTALIAMAMGKTVVSGGKPEFYDFIGEKENKPIVDTSIDIDKLTDNIRKAALDRDFLIGNSEKSRKFVEKHNDINIVTKRFLKLWNRG